MKGVYLFLCSASLACSAFAQSAPPASEQPKSSQPVQLQLECRDLGGDKTAAPDETLINGMACRPIKAKQASIVSVAVPDSKPAPVSVTAPSSAPDATKDAQPASEVKKDAVQPSEPRPCVILKRMGPADEITSRLYSFGIRGKQFQYVEGDLPKGVKFHGRLTDNDVRNIQTHGGKVAILEPGYAADNLKGARQSCKEQ